MTNVCCKCFIEKPLDLFVKNSRSKTGFSGRCKECHNKISKISAENNKESRKASIDKYYQSHKLVCAERVASWALNNQKKSKEIAKRSRVKNANKIKEYRKQKGLLQAKVLRIKYPDHYMARNAVNNAVAKKRYRL